MVCEGAVRDLLQRPVHHEGGLGRGPSALSRSAIHASWKERTRPLSSPDVLGDLERAILIQRPSSGQGQAQSTGEGPGSGTGGGRVEPPVPLSLCLSPLESIEAIQIDSITILHEGSPRQPRRGLGLTRKEFSLALLLDVSGPSQCVAGQTVTSPSVRCSGPFAREQFASGPSQCVSSQTVTSPHVAGPCAREQFASSPRVTGRFVTKGHVTGPLRAQAQPQRRPGNDLPPILDPSNPASFFSSSSSSSSSPSSSSRKSPRPGSASLFAGSAGGIPSPRSCSPRTPTPSGNPSQSLEPSRLLHSSSSHSFEKSSRAESSAGERGLDGGGHGSTGWEERVQGVGKGTGREERVEGREKGTRHEEFVPEETDVSFDHGVASLNTFPSSRSHRTHSRSIDGYTDTGGMSLHQAAHQHDRIDGSTDFGGHPSGQGAQAVHQGHQHDSISGSTDNTVRPSQHSTRAEQVAPDSGTFRSRPSRAQCEGAGGRAAEAEGERAGERSGVKRGEERGKGSGEGAAALARMVYRRCLTMAHERSPSGGHGACDSPTKIEATTPGRPRGSHSRSGTPGAHPSDKEAQAQDASTSGRQDSNRRNPKAPSPSPNPSQSPIFSLSLSRRAAQQSPLHAPRGLDSPRVLTPGRVKSQRYTGGVAEARQVSGERLRVVTSGRQGGLRATSLAPERDGGSGSQRYPTGVHDGVPEAARHRDGNKGRLEVMTPGRQRRLKATSLIPELGPGFGSQRYTGGMGVNDGVPEAARQMTGERAREGQEVMGTPGQHQRRLRAASLAAVDSWFGLPESGRWGSGVGAPGPARKQGHAFPSSASASASMSADPTHTTVTAGLTHAGTLGAAEGRQEPFPTSVSSRETASASTHGTADGGVLGAPKSRPFATSGADGAAAATGAGAGAHATGAGGTGHGHLRMMKSGSEGHRNGRRELGDWGGSRGGGVSYSEKAESQQSAVGVGTGAGAGQERDGAELSRGKGGEEGGKGSRRVGRALTRKSRSEIFSRRAIESSHGKSIYFLAPVSLPSRYQKEAELQRSANGAPPLSVGNSTSSRTLTPPSRQQKGVELQHSTAGAPVAHGTSAASGAPSTHATQPATGGQSAVASTVSTGTPQNLAVVLSAEDTYRTAKCRLPSPPPCQRTGEPLVVPKKAFHTTIFTSSKSTSAVSTAANTSSAGGDAIKSKVNSAAACTPFMLPSAKSVSNGPSIGTNTTRKGGGARSLFPMRRLMAKSHSMPNSLDSTPKGAVLRAALAMPHRKENSSKGALANWGGGSSKGGLGAIQVMPPRTGDSERESLANPFTWKELEESCRRLDEANIRVAGIDLTEVTSHEAEDGEGAGPRVGGAGRARGRARRGHTLEASAFQGSEFLPLEGLAIQGPAMQSFSHCPATKQGPGASTGAPPVTSGTPSYAHGTQTGTTPGPPGSGTPRPGPDSPLKSPFSDTAEGSFPKVWQGPSSSKTNSPRTLSPGIHSPRPNNPRPNSSTTSSLRFDSPATSSPGTLSPRMSTPSSRSPMVGESPGTRLLHKVLGRVREQWDATRHLSRHGSSHM